MSHRFNHDRRSDVLRGDIAGVSERHLQFLTNSGAFSLACVVRLSHPSPFGKRSAWIERGWWRHQIPAHKCERDSVTWLHGVYSLNHVSRLPDLGLAPALSAMVDW